MSHQNYFGYILTNDGRHPVIYIRVTNELERLANEHSLSPGRFFPKQYNADKPIYFEAYSDPDSAIAREKQLKNWSRKKKEALIARTNPEWQDLMDQMYAPAPKKGAR